MSGTTLTNDMAPSSSLLAFACVFPTSHRTCLATNPKYRHRHRRPPIPTGALKDSSDEFESDYASWKATMHQGTGDSSYRPSPVSMQVRRFPSLTEILMETISRPS
jgi:hypothetical protein